MMKNRLLLALSFSALLVCSPSISARSGTLEIIDHRTEQEGLFNNNVTAVSPAGDNGVFIASPGGLHIFLDYFFLPIFQNIPAIALSQDPGADLWAAADGGLIYRITEREGIWSAIRIPFDRKKRITVIAARHGAVTIGTDSGLYYYDSREGAFHTILKRVSVTALVEPPDGTIIAGARDETHKRGGLLIVGGAFASRTGWVQELSNKTVCALFVDGDRLLVGTEQDGVFVLDGAALHAVSLPEKPGRIAALLVHGSITMIATEQGLYGSAKGGPFQPLTTDDGVTPTGITSLSPGPGSSVWVGTQKDGIYLIRVRP